LQKLSIAQMAERFSAIRNDAFDVAWNIN